MPLSINLPATPLTVTPAEFIAIAAENPDLRLERTVTGELIVNPLTGGESGRRNADIIIDLGIWTRQYGGYCFDSSTGFVLPNGAARSPDASWVAAERYDALPRDERERLLPLPPDFAIELRSPTDALATLRAKMCEYSDNSVRLGWLVDPDTNQVEIYRPDRDPEIVRQPDRLSAPDILPSFVLPLTRLWTRDANAPPQKDRPAVTVPDTSRDGRL